MLEDRLIDHVDYKAEHGDEYGTIIGVTEKPFEKRW